VGYYDYNNSTPSTTSTTVYNKFHVYYSEYTGTTRDPKLEITLATGFGHATIGVASANIGRVNGVATANVGKVIGVD
jgi:hypothetical protein